MTTHKRRARSRLRSAQADVVVARAALDRAASPWRAFAQRHRSALIIGAGFACGLSAGAMPRRVWSMLRSGFAFATAAFVRTLVMPIVMPAIAGTLFAAPHAGPDARAGTTSGDAD